jgi:cyclic pyranopterin phosphate synthase
MLSHVNDKNQPQMVDVSEKKANLRTAHARSEVYLPDSIYSMIKSNDIQSKKGPVFHTAIIAGVMAAKQTGNLVPFCHPIGLEDCQIIIEAIGQNKVQVDCITKVTAKTGVEMEALMGASIAALTIYDMCKAMSHDIQIISTSLISKTGGKKDFQRLE